ncbi:MAG: VWA domain-containing protein [Acidobacteria bacterium]|nr:VWA domain-containing protein [Acidobacteriota bacterium]
MGGAARRLTGCLLLGVVLCAPVHAAQEPAAAQTFADTVSVTELLVHVVVTGRDGDPVTDLEQEDFVVHVDGDRGEITGFRRTLLREQATNRTAGAVVAEGPRGPPVSVVVYLDEAGTRFFDRRRFLHRVQREAEALRAWNARFALVTSGDHVQIRVPPTEDLDAVLAAVDALPLPKWRSRQTGRHFQRAREQVGEVLFAPYGDGCGEGFPQVTALVKGYEVRERRRTAERLDALWDVVTAFSGVPGRKVVLYVGNGFAQVPGEELHDYVLRHCLGVGSGGGAALLGPGGESSKLFDQVAAHANANNTTLYMLDAGGVPSISHSGRSWRLNRQGGMTYLSRKTGGRTLFNSNALGPLLDDAEEHLDASYELAVAVADQKPGALRQIDVELAPTLRRQGHRLAYRRSWQDKSRDQMIAERLVSTAWLDGNWLAEAANPLSVAMRFTATTPLEADGDRRRRRNREEVHELVVRVAIPELAATLLPGPDGDRGTLGLWLMAVERNKGYRTPVRRMLLELGGPEGLRSHGGFHFVDLGVKLWEGEYTVVLGVVDEPTGTMSVLREATSVPSTG